MTGKPKEGISIKETVACEVMVKYPNVNTQLWLDSGERVPFMGPLSSGDTWSLEEGIWGL